jgi:hypothetical protein
MPSSDTTRILSSQWGGLSPHLLARFYPVRRKKSGDGWEQATGKNKLSDTFAVDDSVEVWCPITDGTTDMTMNWSSPFENSGSESKAPMLSAMLQSGSATSLMQALSGMGIASKTMDSMAKKSVDFLRDVEGRTGITKLNSTQIFTGMPPMKITVTAHFRALIDPVAEVRDPIMQLEEWAVPQLMASDGLIANAAKNGADAVSNGFKNQIIDTLYPSRTPQILGLKYGDMALMPVVIEGISKPITNPRGSTGVVLAQSVQLTITTLAALDRRDMRAIYVK